MDAESALFPLLRHGPLALVLLMALNRLGLIPGGMFLLIGVGILCRGGALPLAVALAAAYLGTMIGDSALYGAGRYGLGWLSRRAGRRDLWARAHDAIERWGRPAIFLTRWLILPLTIAVSLLCGVNRFSYRPFVVVGAAGNLLFVLLFVGVGYRFGHSWPHALDWAAAGLARAVASDTTLLALAVLAAALLAYRYAQRRLAPAPVVEGDGMRG